MPVLRRPVEPATPSGRRPRRLGRSALRRFPGSSIFNHAWDKFPGNRPNKPQSPNDVASRPLPKSPVSSSLDNLVPQMIVRSPRVRPGKFAFSEAKRLLQHNRHFSDISSVPSDVRSSAGKADIAQKRRHVRLWSGPPEAAKPQNPKCSVWIGLQ